VHFKTFKFKSSGLTFRLDFGGTTTTG